MTRIGMALFRAACVALVAAVAASPARAAEKPEAVVEALYRDHFAQDQIWTATLERNRARFAPELLALVDEIERKAAANPGELVGLDFNPLTNAQEEADGFEVKGASPDGASTIVSVVIRFGGEPMMVRLRLTPSGETWRIANILYDEYDLVSILQDLKTEGR